MKWKVEKNWETAQINSCFERVINGHVELKSPHSSHKGCFFDFTQVIYRPVQKLELSAPYKEDDRLCLFTRYLMAILFCPHL